MVVGNDLVHRFSGLTTLWLTYLQGSKVKSLSRRAPVAHALGGEHEQQLLHEEG